MKVLILGATGRTGKFVLKEALEKGYEVHVLVRNDEHIQENENLNIFMGTPVDKTILSQASDGCDSIISVLNISRTSDFPWAKLRTPPTFLSNVMQHVIEVSKANKIKRVIVCSAWGVDTSNKEIPFWFRWMIDYSNIGAAYTDHEQQEKIIKNSDLNWTIVRPVGLISGRRKKVRVSYDYTPKPKLTISRRSVAAFMVNALEDYRLIGKLPVISSD